MAEESWQPRIYVDLLTEGGKEHRQMTLVLVRHTKAGTREVKIVHKADKDWPKLFEQALNEFHSKTF